MPKEKSPINNPQGEKISEPVYIAFEENESEADGDVEFMCCNSASHNSGGIGGGNF